MALKFRLFGSVALAAVGASMAHAQAYAYSYNSAAISIQGATTAVGGYAVGGVYAASLGYSFNFYGPTHGTYGQYSGGAGNYHYAGSVGYNASGYLSHSVAYTLANPNGQVFFSDDVLSGVLISNSNPFAVDVQFTGVTESYTYASQQATGDSAFANGLAELFFDNKYLFQESLTNVEADTLFGAGNSIDQYNYNSYDLGSGSRISYGFGSPFADSAFALQVDYWNIYIAAYGSASISEYTEAAGSSTSTRSSNGTPGPAAVAPFALGLIGALRRRNKR